MAERRYSDEEVARILKNAVDAAPRRIGSSSDAQGLTLAELQTIGAEVGIAADRIQTAALRLDQGQSGTTRALGVPIAFQAERIVDAPLTPDDLPGVLQVIRTATGRRGVVEELLGGLEWTGQTGFGNSYVTVMPQGDRARVHITGPRGAGGMIVGGGSLGVVAGAGLTIAAGLPALLVGLAGVVGFGIMGVAPWMGLFSSEERKLKSVLDRIEEVLVRRSGERGVTLPADPSP